MHPASTPAETKQALPISDGERKCLVTGVLLPKDQLVRFVVDGGGHVVPDLSHNLPGRGLWVSATRDAIETAIAKNLFAKAAKQSVVAKADLLPLVVRLLHKRCLDHVGFARRSGLAVLGQPQVEAAIKARKLAMLLIADDGSTDFKPMPGVVMSRRFTRDELGAALGHEQLVYVGIKPDALVQRLALMLTQLDAIDPDAAPLATNSTHLH